MAMAVPQAYGKHGKDQRPDADCPGKHHVQAHGRQISQRFTITGERAGAQIQLGVQAQPD